MRLLIDIESTACPSRGHFIRVIIVPFVLLLSPVVVEAGLGSGHTVIGHDDLPPVSRCFRFVLTRRRSDSPLLIFYLLPKPKMAPVNVSVP